MVIVRLSIGHVLSSYLINFKPCVSFPSFKVATKTLPFYKDYFNVPYPLPKIDLIAIADFAAGMYMFLSCIYYTLVAHLIST